MKRYLSLAGAVVFGAVLASLVIMTTPLRFLDVVEPTIHEISPTNFQALFSAHPDNYIFIDVRTHEDYVAEHAQGAINMPLETLYNQHNYLPKKGKIIVFICNGAQASGVAYGYMEHYGFLNLMRVTGGVPAWKAAGLPLVSGDSTSTAAGYTTGVAMTPEGYIQQCV